MKLGEEEGEEEREEETMAGRRKKKKEGRDATTGNGIEACVWFPFFFWLLFFLPSCLFPMVTWASFVVVIFASCPYSLPLPLPLPLGTVRPPPPYLSRSGVPLASHRPASLPGFVFGKPPRRYRYHTVAVFWSGA